MAGGRWTVRHYEWDDYGSPYGWHVLCEGKIIDTYADRSLADGYAKYMNTREENGMEAMEAAKAIREGKTIRMAVGEEPDDPVLIVWDDNGGVVSVAVAGWSEGVHEAVCSLGSDFLEKCYFRGKLEVVSDDKRVELVL